MKPTVYKLTFKLRRTSRLTNTLNAANYIKSMYSLKSCRENSGIANDQLVGTIKRKIYSTTVINLNPYD